MDSLDLMSSMDRRSGSSCDGVWVVRVLRLYRGYDSSMAPVSGKLAKACAISAFMIVVGEFSRTALTSSSTFEPVISSASPRGQGFLCDLGGFLRYSSGASLAAMSPSDPNLARLAATGHTRPKFMREMTLVADPHAPERVDGPFVSP